MIRAAGIVAASLALLGASSAHALTLQDVGDFDQPTYVTSDPGDAGRLFVVEREGTIQLVEDGVASEFVDLSASIDCGGKCQGERGLMSIALARDFDQSGRLYVDYASELDEAIHVDELTAEPNLLSADPATLKPLLDIDHSDSDTHHGGQLQFGTDGNLYVSTGDGGGNGDQFENAQDLEAPLGKILRIRPDPSVPSRYTVPPDNPFVANPTDYAPIWSYGLRNPFRFSFDRLTGDMVIGDVGQEKREEIDFAPSPFPGMVGGEGSNYGWNCHEGFIAGPAGDPECASFPPEDFIDPVFDYPHTPDPDIDADRCAIVGGYVARDPSLGSLYGRYLYSDYCSGALRSLRLPASGVGRAADDCWLGLDVNHPVSFGEDAARRLYVVEQGGHVYRIGGVPPTVACPAQAEAPLSPPAPEVRAQPKPSFIGIKAQRRRVERGKIALLTVWVSPCTGRKGQSVELLRNGHSNGTRFLSRACTARFLPRVRRGTTFAAFTREERGYLPGESRRLTIRLAHRQHHH